MNGYAIFVNMLKSSSTSKPNHSAGFTLVEIAVAVVLLGVAFTTLIGLESRLVDTYQQERNLTQAALYAGYLMTMIEVEQSPPDVGTHEQELAVALGDTGYFDDDRALSDPKQLLTGWRYEKSVSSVSIPFLEDALRRVDLTIRWGDSSSQRYTLVYFIANSKAGQRTNPAS